MGAPRPPCYPVGMEASPLTLRSAWRLGGLSPLELARRVVGRFSRDEVFDRAAGLSYYFLFSLFPLLICLTAVFGLVSGRELMSRLMDNASHVLPRDAASLLRKTMQQVTSGARGGFASIGFAASLWTATSGTDSLIAALNQAFETRSPRSWWRRRLIAFALTVGFSLASIVALLVVGFGGPVAQWTLAPLAALGGVGLVYRFGPAERAGGLVLTPGAVFAVAAWGAASYGLRVYVGGAARYNAVYGSIGAVVVLLLWLYLSALTVLAGAEIDAEIERAVAPPVSGSRGAQPRRRPAGLTRAARGPRSRRGDSARRRTLALREGRRRRA